VTAVAMPTRRQSLTAHLLLIAVTLVWGCTFPLVKAALREVSPLLFNLLRMALASAVLLAFNHRTLKQLTRPQLKLCALAGLCLALGYELQTTGLTRTTPSKSAFLTGLVVVMVPLLSTVPGLRVPDTPRPHAAAYLGALIAFAGIILLTSDPHAGLALLSGLHLGEWLTLLCAVAFAVHLLTLARGANRIPARTLGTLQIVFATLTMLLFLPLDRPLRFHLTPTVVTALAVTAILATAAAFTIQSWAQQHLPASHTALIFTLEPVFAWLTSLLFLGERLGPRNLTGAGLILLGIVLAELGPTVLSQAAILPVEP
jgi:drug/metabolite transporter (DMT)-like permease